MKARLFLLFLYCLAMASPHSAAAEKRLFRFAIVAPASQMQSRDNDSADLLAALDKAKLAFVVAHGIKSADEPCTDELYNSRKELFEQSENALIPSLTADDWTDCLNSSGKPAAVERLNRVRELFFSEKKSFGQSKLPLVRQSITPQFRSYSENSRWRYRNVLFATVHLPQNNNNYVSEAGRNNEFEDRHIANRDWLQKLFIFAKRKKMDGIVLFSDGNPLAIPSPETTMKSKARRDGFLEVRKQLLKLASGFSGKILIVHRQKAGRRASEQSTSRIRWTRNIGETEADAGISMISVTTAPMLFMLEEAAKKKDLSTNDQP